MFCLSELGSHPVHVVSIDSTALQAVDINHLSSDNTLIECSSLETAPSDDRSGNPTTLDKQRYIIIIT